MVFAADFSVAGTAHGEAEWAGSSAVVPFHVFQQVQAPGAVDKAVALKIAREIRRGRIKAAPIVSRNQVIDNVL